MVARPRPADAVRAIGAAGGAQQRLGLAPRVHHEGEVALHRLQVADGERRPRRAGILRLRNRADADGEAELARRAAGDEDVDALVDAIVYARSLFNP